jgi:hypothetical protein
VRLRKPKQLTYDEQGRTNNTCLRLDGNEVLFGHPPGRWQDLATSLGMDQERRPRDGKKSTWLYPEQVVVTQTVEIVRSPSSGRLDTCLVLYQIDNLDSRPHRVGLRFMLDTFIGANDGVPFTIPGFDGLCDTLHRFSTSSEVPDFIQALEEDDLARPGTIAHLQLRLGGRVEAPEQVTLGAWPNVALQMQQGERRFQQHMTMWDVPVVPLKAITSLDRNAPADSAVIMYWPERDLKPGENRELGFSYGLGSVASTQSAGKLGIAVSEAVSRGTDFTVTASVRNPDPGQKLVLVVPAGLRLLAPEAEQPVPLPGPDAPRRISTVSWRVKAQQVGKHPLRVESSSGAAETKVVRVTAEGIFGRN